MIQQIIVYILLALAIVYVGFRIYNNVKAKQACAKCALMDAAKKTDKVNV